LIETRSLDECGVEKTVLQGLKTIDRQRLAPGLKPGVLKNCKKPCDQSDFLRLAGGTIPFMRKYSAIWP
jgi:hypothetical protein